MKKIFILLFAIVSVFCFCVVSFADETCKVVGNQAACVYVYCGQPLPPEKMADDLHRSIINLSVDSIEEKLEYILENPQILRVIGENGYKYVHNWHDPIKVTKNVLTYYKS